jgi:hypothetical protein
MAHLPTVPGRLSAWSRALEQYNCEQFIVHNAFICEKEREFFWFFMFVFSISCLYFELCLYF